MDNAFICTTMHTNWGQKNHLKTYEQEFNYDLKVLFHCLESLDKFFLTDSGMLHPLIEISTGSGRTPTFSALFLTAESTDSLICSKGIICRPKHNCCFLPISSWTFFLKSHGWKPNSLDSISPTHHGGPYFSFLVVQQPRRVAIANNCKALSWLKRMADMSVFINLHLNSRQSKSDCKAKQK